MRSRRIFTASAVTIAGLLTACGNPSGESGGSNPDVPASASAQEVVDGYLQALNEKDARDAVALTIDGFDWRDAWSDNPPTVSDVHIGDSSPWDLEGPAPEVYAEGVTVPASVVLRGAEQVPDGPAELMFILWKGRVNNGWLIAGINDESPPARSSSADPPSVTPDRRSPGPELGSG